MVAEATGSLFGILPVAGLTGALAWGQPSLGDNLAPRRGAATVG